MADAVINSTIGCVAIPRAAFNKPLAISISGHKWAREMLGLMANTIKPTNQCHFSS